jgi:hypothetical protein
MNGTLSGTPLSWTLCASAFLLAGCAGNGEGLDENGRPVGEGGEAPLTANLQSIQDNVFTPICSQCHAGAAAPLGFRLDQDSAYAMLVNTPSVEVSSLQRVTPGDPDSSYLIQKLEGRAAVGGQMPLGQPPLPQATIAVIRQWIANGAPAASAAAPATVMPMQLHPIAPTVGESLNSETGEILLQADGELNAATLGAGTVRLTRTGGDGAFDDGNDVSVQPITVEVRSLDPTVLAVKLPNGAWTPDRYRLVVSGHGGAPATDSAGIPIGDFSMEFSVGGAQ